MKASKNFERNVLRFICLIGLLRMVYELYYDYVSSGSTQNLLIDGFFLLIMAAFLVLSYYPIQIKWLTYPISILGLLFFTYAWLDEGGLQGRSEYNYIIYMVAMCVMHSGRSQIVFVLIGLTVQISLVIIWQLDDQVLQPLVRQYSTENTHFVLYIVMAGAMIIYLRFKNDKEEAKLSFQEIKLSEKSKALDIENDKLRLQQEEFEQINAHLEGEIAQRKEELEAQNNSLKQFIELSVQDFYPPLRSTLDAIAELEKEQAISENMEMLVKTGHKLESAYSQLKVKMRENIS